MKKLLATLFLFSSIQLTAQTLFYYGKDSVSVKDFLKAYQKNNTGPRSEKAFLDYADLYIASRLKVAEAISMGLDTLPQMVSDMQNLRQQLVPSYMVDRGMLKGMADEAFKRAQKDVHLAHIFISFEKPGELENATKKKNELLEELNKKGPAAFADLAKKYSDDPSAESNGGELGWVTVFSLPYELENLAYSTPVGKVSGVHQSKAGFHIFRNLGERKALGKIKAAQILLAFPAGVGEAYKAEVKRRADSIYNRLLKGDDFTKLVKEYSNDVISAASNGQIPEFGVGEYEPDFEKAVFGLVKDGAFTKPILTQHGYHIVKRLKKIPVPASNTAEVQDGFLNQIEMNDRIRVVKTQQYQNILKYVSISKSNYDINDIRIYTDSILNYVSPGGELKIKGSTVLFELSDKKQELRKPVTAADWIGFAQVFRYKSDGSGTKDYVTLWNEFTEAQVSGFYETNLEYFNEEFRNQLHEFRDGNLFFEVMQQKVWGPAQTDTSALVAYYENNKAKYLWKPGADAVIFFASDAAASRSFMNSLTKSPRKWTELVNENSENISADSARFEIEQIPMGKKQVLRKGMITSPVTNTKDKSVSFAYIINLHTQTEQRNFNEAKGLVISDFQEDIERRWVEELRKKYEVKINQAELDKLIGEKKWL